ncbi:hypothetical protein [Ahrensia sp. R2A130]|uniref:hypothetical protein n=1 Tax=Ahrensia sp. R2A130 TaxID=744979 RepID=UPI0001E0BCC6|nr:hypothetical protein [Ahrensia sp. R2A130]EFL88334.1 AMP-dependent synthetase and ligase [Ahrensia sp. R2A130]
MSTPITITLSDLEELPPGTRVSSVVEAMRKKSMTESLGAYAAKQRHQLRVEHMARADKILMRG